MSTVSREVAANGGSTGYRAVDAHQRAGHRARRPKRAKLSCPALAAKVTTWLEQCWSPEEIANRLRTEHPDDPMMQVSYETIYQSLFVQGRGELRRELHRCLRSGRAERRPRSRLETRGQIPDKVMISERPLRRPIERCLGTGRAISSSARVVAPPVGTLVERTTRYVMLLHLGDGRKAVKVAEAMRSAIGALPDELVRSVTWDQGKEMSAHRQFTIDTGIQIYFCDPRSPWQRGSNENTNGLLRPYVPKGTDLSAHSAEDLAQFAASLNNRPRKTLGYMTPLEKLTELLALTG